MGTRSGGPLLSLSPKTLSPCNTKVKPDYKTFIQIADAHLQVHFVSPEILTANKGALSINLDKNTFNQVKQRQRRDKTK